MFVFADKQANAPRGSERRSCLKSCGEFPAAASSLKHCCNYLRAAAAARRFGDTAEEKVDGVERGQPFSLPLLTLTRAESSFIGGLQPRKWSRAAASIVSVACLQRRKRRIWNICPWNRQRADVTFTWEQTNSVDLSGLCARRGPSSSAHLPFKAPRRYPEEPQLSASLGWLTEM